MFSLPYVKRNFILILTSEAIFTIINQFYGVVGTIIVYGITGSEALAGLGSGFVWGGRVAISYVSGKIGDKYGRKPAMLISCGMTGAALLLMTYAVQFSSSIVLFPALVLLGLGFGAHQMSRVAVTDMFPSNKRDRAVGYLYTSGVLGSFLATIFISLSTSNVMLPGLNMPASAWILTVPLVILTATLYASLKPDPKEIGLTISQMYKGESKIEEVTRFSVSSLIRTYAVVATNLSSATSNGAMDMVISLTSLLMYRYQIPLFLISVAVTIHVLGLYALAVPLGTLSGRYGKGKVMILGLATGGLGALITPLTSEYLVITLGVFLVGLGWSAVSVSSTILLGDLSPTQIRGRILGTNDMGNGLASLIFPFAGGAVIELGGYAAFGFFGLLVNLPAVLALMKIDEKHLTSPTQASKPSTVSQKSSNSKRY
jgi:MFS family permease